MSQGDPIQKEVENFLKAYPQFKKAIKQLGDGDYKINGNAVKVGFCRGGFLVVHDGPLRQPFVDYVEKKDVNQQYHHEGLKSSSLASQPKETRISFGDEGNRYSRLDAMKVAKEQALYREKAASYLSEGQSVPSDLREKYEKTISNKLSNQSRWSAPRAQQGVTQALPVASPVAAEPAAQPMFWPSAAAGVPTAPHMAPATAPAPVPVNLAPIVRPLTSAYTSGPVPVAVGSPNALFGQVPDLIQMAAARQAPKAGAPVAGTVAYGMPAHVPCVRGPLCGA